MKVTVEIELDESWNEYFYLPSEKADVAYLSDIKPDLFLEDLFGNWDKDGVKGVKIVKINK